MVIDKELLDNVSAQAKGISEMNRAFPRKDFRLHVIRSIVSYSNGKKSESVEFIGIEALD